MITTEDNTRVTRFPQATLIINSPHLTSQLRARRRQAALAEDQAEPVAQCWCRAVAEVLRKIGAQRARAAGRCVQRWRAMRLWPSG